MAATPEEFLGQAGLLARPGPPSPSISLDLPPTPRGEEDPASSLDDMVLAYISRLFMEEGMDDHFLYQYPDHPALLRAQLPFAQILVDVGSGSSTTLSPFSSSSTDAAASPSTASPYDAIQALHSPRHTGVAGLASGSPADMQSSEFCNGEEEAARTATFPGGSAEQGTLSSGFFRYLLPGDLLARPGPPSPSIFRDLPPTPRGEEDPASSFDDMVLPYISRLLMEEGMDDHFYQYPDHPALLQAQQPFAQILVDVGSGSSTTLSPFSSSTDAAASPSTASPYDAIQALHSPRHTGVGGLASGSPADMQSSEVCNGEEEAARTATFPGGSAEQGTLSSGFFRYLLPGDQDMINLAFLKGMEEAKKFMPTNSGLPIDLESSSGEFLPTFAVKEEGLVDGVPAGGGNGGGRKKKRYDRDKLEVEVGRASKLMMPEPEEDGAREMLDEMMLQEHEICMKGVQDLRIDVDNKPEKNSRKVSGNKARRRRGTSDSEMVDLHRLLLHCAQAVSTDDHRSASELLKQIKQNSSPRGDAAQRLAHYFAEGLEARLAGRGSELYRSLMAKRTSVVDFLKANQLLMAACCCKKVAFIFSNKTIYNAVAGRSRLHIVDYGLNGGFQWPGLLRVLAAREGGPPEVRITGIDLPQPGFRGDYHIEETGRRLSNCARVFGVPFKFRGIAAKRETVRPEDLNIDRDEVLVVISLCHFRNLMDENLGFNGPSPRDKVLNNIRRMQPDVFIHGILNGSYGSTYILSRFRKALFHYSAQFDLLDVIVPRDNEGRLLLERDILGQSALNVLACEGADRVERPETYKQWQLRNHRAGLRQLPLNPEVVKLVLDKVKDNYHKDFVVNENQRWLLHRWKGRVLYAWSTWVADDATSRF